jgi:hypothetical protein
MVNIKQSINQMNLEYLNDFCERNYLKPHFVNLSEYENKNDKVFERFIKNSLNKKPTTSKEREERKYLDNSPDNIKSQFKDDFVKDNGNLSAKNCLIF